MLVLLCITSPDAFIANFIGKASGAFHFNQGCKKWALCFIGKELVRLQRKIILFHVASQ